MPAFEVNYDALWDLVRETSPTPPLPRRDSRGRFASPAPPPFLPRCGEADCTRCPGADGYLRNGFNRETGTHRNGTRYDDEGYDRRGYNSFGRDRDGRDLYGYDCDGYDRSGYDASGYDRDGYGSRGFTRYGVHRNGTTRDDEGYDSRGLDESGFDSEGYDEYGHNEDGYNRYGYDRDGYDEDGYNEDGVNEDGYNRYGDYERDESGALHNYSYTPRLQFRGDGAPWFGMELEVTADRVSRLVGIVEQHAGNLIYCKEDGSVDGAELVTHPMSYQWAMANFPWQMLPALRDEADGRIIPSDNGIHVHVSRDGFDGSAHTFRWLKFWYRNPSDIQRIARRRAATWGAFRPEHRTGQFEHSKMGKPGYDYSADTARQGRYAAINCSNDATLEVRVFASTLRPQRAQAALQLVAATLEYTRQLTADDITHRHGWDWPAFMAWTRKSGQYGSLVAEDRIRRYL